MIEGLLVVSGGIEIMSGLLFRHAGLQVGFGLFGKKLCSEGW